MLLDADGGTAHRQAAALNETDTDTKRLQLIRRNTVHTAVFVVLRPMERATQRSEVNEQSEEKDLGKFGQFCDRFRSFMKANN